jgi:hypothetical protein
MFLQIVKLLELSVLLAIYLSPRFQSGEFFCKESFSANFREWKELFAISLYL